MSSESKVTREAFLSQLQSKRLVELRQICADDGLQLQSTHKDAAIAEMWAHYSGSALMRPIAQPAPAPALEPVAASPVRFEARLSRALVKQGSTAVYRLGKKFGLSWQEISADEHEALKAQRVVETRIRG